MNKENMNKEKIKVILIWITCIVFFILHIILGYVRYETNDDQGINAIAAGLYGKNNSEYLVYTNVLYGFLLKIFYSISSNINWYLWIMLVLNLIALSILCLVFSEKKSIKLALFITVLFNVMLGTQIYNVLQYTKNAAFYNIVGFCALIISYRNNKRIYSIIGCIFFVLGFIIRNECVFMVLPFIGIFLFVELIKVIREKSSVKRFIIPYIITFICILLSYSVDYMFQQNPKEWKAYWNYIDELSELANNGMSDYENNSDMYDSIGWGEDEIALFKYWITIDDDVYSLTNLETAANAKKNDDTFDFKLDMQYVSTLVQSIVVNGMNHFTNKFILYVLILCVLLFTNKKSLLFVVANTLILIGEYGYLVYIDRVIWRVEFGIWISYFILSGLFLVCYISLEKGLIKVTTLVNKIKKNEKYDLKRIFAFIILGVCFLLTIEKTVFLTIEFYDSKDGNIFVKRNYPCADLIDMTRNDSNIYYIDTFTFSNRFRSVFDIKGSLEGFEKKYVDMGGWGVLTPSCKNYLGDNYPQLKDLYINDNVFFVDMDNTNEIVLSYLQNHYDNRIVAEQVGTVNGLYVWKYYILDR